MLDAEAIILDELGKLSPFPSSVAGDWQEVLRRADAQSSLGRTPPHSRVWRQALRALAKRRVVVVLAGLVAVIVPVIALGAANDWWFFTYGSAPTPRSAPVVVKHGVWNGHPWDLDAYRSGTNGLCFALKATDSNEGAGMGCVTFVGIARTNQTQPGPELTITFASHGGNRRFPAYIVGPVIAAASKVKIQFPDGQVLRVPTFAAPRSLGRVRFYVTPLPAHEFVPKWVAGLDAHGRIVACILVGYGGRRSPLLACK
jgi:hypothetical protein